MRLIRIVLSIIFLFAPLLVSRANEVKEVKGEEAFSLKNVGVDSLNKVLSHRQDYVEGKLRFIAAMESRLKVASNDNDRLQALSELYNEYSTFRFDSAMVKVEQMMDIAQSANRNEYMALSNIYMADLLTTSGLFHEALGYLGSVQRKDVPEQYLTEYFKAYEWTYSMLAEYANGSKFAESYYNEEKAYQDSIISTLNPDSPQYYYWMGEKEYRQGNIDQAQQYYHEAFSTVDIDNRLFAQVAFGLALCAKAKRDTNAYKEYLTLSSISDQVCPLKENLALQTLALELASESNDNLELANTYLNYSLEDAIFYGNRLRMIEIFQKIPTIVGNYEQELISNNRTKTTIIYICIAIAILLAGAVIFGVQKRKQLKESQRRLDASYKELSETNKKLEEAYALLESSHQNISSTNVALKEHKQLREDSIRLFIDLTVAYISKLNMFHQMVQRKIKAKQVDDLIRYTNPSRMTEAEAREFFNSFDKSFRKAFPNFIEGVNSLLQPEHKITVPENELNLDLRILALIRLGIRDSSKIATLLNLSPKTIYNHRSAIRSYAIDRDSFETALENIM